MRSQDVFRLNQLRRQIVMQETLGQVHPPLPYQEFAVCPHCQFKSTRKPRLNQQIFLCVQCRQKFQQRLPIHCDCPAPGSIPLCQYCPHFQLILIKVQQRVEQLRHLDFAELRVNTGAESSLASQMAQLQNAGVVEVLTDVQRGRLSKRAGFNRLIALIQAGQVETVIVTRVDRLSRSLTLLKQFLDVCQSKKVALQVLEQPVTSALSLPVFKLCSEDLE